MAGRYFLTGGGTRLMTDTVTDGAWSAIETPVPVGGVTYPDSFAVGTACFSDVTCIVTQSYYPAGNSASADAIDTLSDGTWSTFETPVPLGGKAGSGRISTGTGHVTINPSACSADGVCVVAGEYDPAGGGSSRGMIVVGEKQP